MKEELINHILRSKEMLHREENMQKYIGMIKNKIYIKNPLDRAIAALFELVIEKEIDPRNIDLISFSKLYIDKLKRNGGVNLFVAGKIILLAWKILRMQSEEILENMERKEEEISYEIPEWYGDDEIFYYTQRVIENEIPLERKIRRKAGRKVTLIELINAFEEAKEEIERREKRRKIKEREMKALQNNVSNIGEHTHKEDIEKDIKRVMERLSKLNGRAIPLRELYSDKKEIISVLLPLLFLAKEEVIMLWQENFPYGEIYIKLNHGS